MPATKHHLTIHAAVMNCIARCADTDAPFVVLGDFLEKLRSRGWQTEDVEAVGHAVLPMLSELKTGGTVATGYTNLAAGKSLGQIQDVGVISSA
jgi:hypothetical protein